MADETTRGCPDRCDVCGEPIGVDCFQQECDEHNGDFYCADRDACESRAYGRHVMLITLTGRAPYLGHGGVRG